MNTTSTPRIKAPVTTARLIRMHELLSTYYPVSKSKLYEDIKKGNFPKPVKLGERVSAWKIDEVIAATHQMSA